MHNAAGDQSRYLRQLYLTVNTTVTDCDCPADYYIQTNIGPRGQDACSGDSGGPLVAKETEGRLTVVGILRERYKEIKIFCLILFRALPDCGSPLYPCLTAVEVWTAPSCLMTTSA